MYVAYQSILQVSQTSWKNTAALCTNFLPSYWAWSPPYSTLLFREPFLPCSGFCISAWGKVFNILSYILSLAKCSWHFLTDSVSVSACVSAYDSGLVCVSKQAGFSVRGQQEESQMFLFQAGRMQNMQRLWGLGLVGRKSWIKVGRFNEEASCGRCGRLFTSLPSPAPPAFHLYPPPSYLGQQQPLQWKAFVFGCLSDWSWRILMCWRRRKSWDASSKEAAPATGFFATFKLRQKFTNLPLLYVKCRLGTIGWLTNQGAMRCWRRLRQAGPAR